MALTDWLQAYYKMDTGSWTTAFDSVWTNDWTINWAIWTTWKINDGLNFDWVDDEVQIPHNTNLNWLTWLTLAWWFKFDSISWSWNEYALIDKRTSTEVKWNYWLYIASWVVQFRMYNTTNDTSNLIIWATTISANTWYYMVATYDDSTWEENIYINGSNDANAIRTSWIVSWSNNTQILRIWECWQSWDFSNLDWFADEVWIWNRALTSTEITELYNNWNGLQYPFPQPSIKKWNIFFK